VTPFVSSVESTVNGHLSNPAYSIVGVNVAKRKLDLYLLDESGTKQGVRKIHGGRRDVRRALFMAALVASLLTMS
jgi:hypothetical protein